MIQFTNEVPMPSDLPAAAAIVGDRCSLKDDVLTISGSVTGTDITKLNKMFRVINIHGIITGPTQSNIGFNFKF